MGLSEPARGATLNPEVRALFPGLVGAHADEIAITKNVSEGLNLFAASLGWSARDNVVVCPRLEHPNNIYLWRVVLSLRTGVLRFSVGLYNDDGDIDRVLESVRAVKGRRRVGVS